MINLLPNMQIINYTLAHNKYTLKILILQMRKKVNDFKLERPNFCLEYCL